MSFVTRFAPSPSGYLHLGHAFSAIFVWRAAQEAGGLAHLRIEDIDRTRCRPEYETAIHEDLDWLGLNWAPPCWRQSERMEDYGARLMSLIDRGLVYRCFRTRKELEEISSAPHGSLGVALSPGPLPTGEEERLMAEGRPYAWRLSLVACRDELGPTFEKLAYHEETDAGVTVHPVTPAQYGDVVLGRKDSGTSYHLASVHDDIALNVTHVIRGEDLREAAGLHVLLYTLFEEPAPIYRHHRLITDDSGKRLAKRDMAATLRALREKGVTPAEVVSRLGL